MLIIRNINVCFVCLFAIVFAATYTIASSYHDALSHHTVWLVSPVNDSYTNQNNDSILFTFNHTGYLLGVVNCTLFLDGSSVNYTTGVPADTNTGVYSNVSINEGARYWWINCTNGTVSESSLDAGGNFTLNVDWTLPFIGFVDPTPDDGNMTTSNWAYINGTISDSGSPDNLTAFIDWNRSLVGWWRFNLESGENDTFVRDWSSYGNNGTILKTNPGIDNCTGNCSGWTTNGKFGYAMRFDGVDDYVDAGNGASFGNMGAMTVEVWFKTITLGAVVGRLNSTWITAPNGDFNLQVGNVIYFQLRMGGSTRTANTANLGLDDDVWHHVIGVWNNDNLYIYVDGGLKTGPVAASGAFNVSTNKIFIGKREASTSELPYNGSIDEVRIWNRALSEEEINASYNTGIYRLYHNFTNLTEGTYTYTAYAQDLAGNVNQTETRTITIDLPPYSVNICQDLTIENGVYILTGNVSSAGTCFTIKADNITLDGGGYWITYSQSEYTTGYAINNSDGYDNITIKNSNIVQDSTSLNDYAIYFSGLTNGTIQNNTITTSGINAYGVRLVSSSDSSIANNTITTSGINGAGVFLALSSSSSIANNTISISGDSGYGVRLASSSSSSIANNTIITLGINGVGVYLDSSSNSNIANNTITTLNTSGYGVELYDYSNYNAIANNIITTSGSGGDGVFLYTSSNSNITNNTITTSGSGGDGVWFYGSNTNTLLNNIISTSNTTAYGVYILSSSSNNITGGSVIAKNSYDYYWEDAGTTSNVTNTNFTALRQIYFADATSWFNYRNDSSNNIWLKTNVSAAGSINRTLINWNNALMLWNDTNSTADVDTRYNITGLLADTIYHVYNTSGGIQTKSYALTTDANGILPSFTIELRGKTKIKVQEGKHIITILSPLNKTYNTNTVWFNVTSDDDGSWCGYSLDGAANVSMANDTTTLFFDQNDSMADGSHYCEISCNDTLGNMNISIAYFAVDTEPPIITNLTASNLIFNKSVKTNISVEFTDNLAVNTTSYLVYDSSGNYVCDSGCFMLVDKNVSSTSANITSQWNSIFYVFNSTARAPVKVYPSGASDGFFFGTIDEDGNSTSNNSARVRVFVFDVMNSPDSYLLENASNTSQVFNYTPGVSTFTTDAPTGENKTVVMDSIFNVSNELIIGQYYINVTAYDNASNYATNTTSLLNVTCTEAWVYSDWSACSSGIQTRTAIDVNNCGTTTYRAVLSQSCSTGGGSSSGGGSPSGAVVFVPTVSGCVNNTGCMGGQLCEESECVDVLCGYCEYAKDHACRKYECCADTECALGLSCRDNKCVVKDEGNPDGADNIKEDAWRAIESARDAISRNKDIKNTSVAEGVLKEAESAYEDEDYDTAKESAIRASQLVLEALPWETEPTLRGYLNPAYCAIVLLILVIVAVFLKRRDIMLFVSGKGARLHKIEEIEHYIETIMPIIRKMNDEASVYETKLSGFSLIGAKKDAAKRMLDEGNEKADEEIQRIVDMLADLRDNDDGGNTGDERKFNLHRIEEIEKYIQEIKPIIREMKRRALIDARNASLVPLIEAEKNEARRMAEADNKGTNEKIRGIVDRIVALKARTARGMQDEREFNLQRIEEIEQYIEHITPIIRKMKERAAVYEKCHSSLSLIETKRMMGKNNKRTDEEIQKIVDILASLKAETDELNRTDDELASYHKIEEIEQYIEQIRPIITELRKLGYIDDKKVHELSLIEGKKRYAEKLLREKSPFAEAQIDVTVDALADFKKEIEWHIDAHKYEHV
ncbi:MAG: LamG-like jellyroll fold domain-containing protein [archaeon]